MDLKFSVLGLLFFIHGVYTQRICIVGSGIAGSSVAHFMRSYSQGKAVEVEIYEKNEVVGGRMAMVELAGDKFEAGASILHPKNYHTANFVKLLGLKQRTEFEDDDDFGIWDGEKFIFQTLKHGQWAFSRQLTKLLNSLALLWRYKSSLVKMQSYVSDLLEKFLHYYDKSRPIFYTVEEMLKWANLYDLTQNSSENELLEYGLSIQIVKELATMITRINYGQSMNISGMAGAVSLCGSGDGLWAVEGGNWQMAAGLISLSNASLFVNETVTSILSNNDSYEVSLASGKIRSCDAVILATPLDEAQISFTPPVSLPKRHLQHTFATYVRGLLNPEYFGTSSVGKLPKLIGTLELPALPFSSINVLKDYSEQDKGYKIFSRIHLSDELLDKLFSLRSSTIQIDWAAYPVYHAPEIFSPFLLDNHHLYYINAFENAASTMETSAVAAENVAKLVLNRLLGEVLEDKDPYPREKVLVDDL